MTQEEIFSLRIPRYLREELSAVETAEFESYLTENPDFQADIEFQRNLMTARADEPDPSELEFGWARLSRSIDNLESQTPVTLSTETELKNTAVFGGVWKIAAVALACLSIGQAFYITNSEAPRQYELASEAEVPGVSLQLSFKSDANLTHVSDFLVNYSSQIISGPSKLGIYTVAFPDKENCLSMISELTPEESLVDSYTTCTANTKG